MNNKGQALVEYVLIVALIALLTIGAIRIFGGHLKDKITEMSCDVSDMEYVKGEKPGEGKCIDKDTE